MNLSELLITFPEMSKESLRMFRKSVDGAYRNFSREYGDAIEAVFDPVLYFLVWFEKLLQSSPWPIVIPVSYTHLRAHETREDLVCRLRL